MGSIFCSCRSRRRVSTDEEEDLEAAAAAADGDDSDTRCTELCAEHQCRCVRLNVAEHEGHWCPKCVLDHYLLQDDERLRWRA